MSKFIILTKTLLKTTSSITSSKKSYKSLLLILLLLFSFIPLAVGVGQIVSKLYEGFSTIGQEGILLGFAFSGISVVILIFGIFTVLGVFYFSSDTESLLYLPLRSETILGAKFFSVLTYEYLVEGFILIPVLIAYGIKANVGLSYYFYATFIFLALPIIPLVISSVLIIIIMSFSNIMKDKERFKAVSGFLTLFLAIGINILIQKTFGDNFSPLELQRMLLEGNNSLVKVVTNLFPTTEFAAIAITDNSIIDMMIFVLINILAVGLFILVGKGLYFKGVLGISEASSKRRILRDKEFNKSIIEGSKIKTYVLKEMRVLFRTTAFLINCISINFLWVLFIFIPFVASPDNIEASKEIIKSISGPENQGILLGVVFGFSMFVNASNNIAVTSITREGKEFFTNSYIPISYKELIISKITPALIMGLVNLALIIIIEVILIKPQVIVIILTIPLNLLALLFTGFIGVLIDINNPKLNWDNEYKAVKQNFNVFINILLNLAVGGGVVVTVFKLKLDMYLTVFTIIIAFLIINIILYKILINTGERMYKRINA